MASSLPLCISPRKENFDLCGLRWIRTGAEQLVEQCKYNLSVCHNSGHLLSDKVASDKVTVRSSEVCGYLTSRTNVKPEAVHVRSVQNVVELYSVHHQRLPLKLLPSKLLGTVL